MSRTPVKSMSVQVPRMEHPRNTCARTISNPAGAEWRWGLYDSPLSQGTFPLKVCGLKGCAFRTSCIIPASPSISPRLLSVRGQESWALFQICRQIICPTAPQLTRRERTFPRRAEQAMPKPLGKTQHLKR